MDITKATDQLMSQIGGFAATSGMKIIGALILIIAGWWLINLLNKKVIKKWSDNQKLDATVSKYISTVSIIVLRILLIISCLGILGVETTSFAAIIGSCGLAIGMAWAGLLSNFAAGAFLIFLRPFKVGDLIETSGVTGTVKEIGLFSTTIETPDRIFIAVGNNSILTGNIKNFSSNPLKRFEMKVLIPAGKDIEAVYKELKEETLKVKGVVSEPAPDINFIEFTPAGTSVYLKPYCKTEDLWNTQNEVAFMIDKFNAKMKE